MVGVGARGVGVWVCLAVALWGAPGWAEPATCAPPGPDEDQVLAREAEQLGIWGAIEGGRGGLVPRQARRMAAAVVREARRNGLDPRLVAAVAIVESEFDPFAVSAQGAIGVMQVTPTTAAWLERATGRPLRARELFDFERNLALGTAYLSSLLKDFRRLDLALLAYNVGPTGARKLTTAGVKPETAAYPRKVAEQYARLLSRTAK